jgi:O-antigen ligase
VGSLIGAAFSNDQASSVFWAFVRAGPTVATLLVVRRWYPGVDTIERSMLAFVAGVAVSALSAIAGFSSVRGVSGRVQGLAHHPNQLAGHALMALGLSLVIALWGRRHRVAFAAFSPVLFIAVMLSGSRSAAAALGAVLAVVGLQGWRQGWKLRQLGAVVALAAILVTGVVSLPSTLTFERLLEKENTEASDGTRWARLESEADRILAHPLTGSGLLARERAHNIYVEALSSAGLLGLLGLLMVMADGVRGGFVRLPKGRNAHDPLLVSICALSTAIVGFAVHEAFQNALWNLWFWLPAGLLLVARDRAAESVRRHTDQLYPATPSVRPVVDRP